MRVTNSVHLNKEDTIKQVYCINNFFNLQLNVIFESGESILIDEAVLNELDKYRTQKKE
jgi:hypothetical protein